jgi:hypothetical protein
VFTRRRLLTLSGPAAPPAGPRLLTGSEPYPDVLTTTSRVQGSDGKVYWVTNHMVQKYARPLANGNPKEYLLVWAGDENVADTAVSSVENLSGSRRQVPVNKLESAPPGPDFLAVIDATRGSPAYGKVVNTATVGPVVENEPHHMQYTWHKGDTVYAGGLFSAMTYAFDVTDLPAIKLKGVSLPIDTPGGSVPDAYWVLHDGTAYCTYMGGPPLPGPHRYSDGSVYAGNGFAGSPGEVVRFDRNGRVLSESPAATPHGDDPNCCDNLPQLGDPACANPHGIQAREDLNTMVTSDFVEPRTVILDPVEPPSPYLYRRTVRTWDISDRNHPKVKSVSYLPDGPGSDSMDPLYRPSSAAMETTVTNLPDHKAAFAQTMKGGAIFYTPDMTATDPQWRQVFDDGTANRHYNRRSDSNGAGTHGGWIQTSPDDRYLYHAMIGRPTGTLGPHDAGTAGGVYVLDISRLVDTGEPPTLVGAVGINPNTPGKGPHFGTVGNFKLGADGKYHETDQPDRLAVFNYFVARSGLDGSHQVFMIKLGKDGSLAVDKAFRDEFTGQVGLQFNRKVWPHGPFGNAKPHKGLFVVADKDLA